MILNADTPQTINLSRGSVITERVYTDVKQDVKKEGKKASNLVGQWWHIAKTLASNVLL